MKEKIKFLIPYWKKGVLPVLYLLISTLVSFFYPLFPKWAIDDVVIKKNYDKLVFIAVFFLFLIIIQRLFLYLNEVTFFKFQKESILNIQQKLIKKVFSYPMDFFNKNHSGYLMGRIRGDVTGLSYIFSASLISIFMDFIKFFGAIFILFTLNVKLTLISICTIPLLLFKVKSSKSSIKNINEKLIEENAKLEKELSDTFQGIEVLKSFSKEEEGIKRTSEALFQYQQTEVKRNKILSQYRNIIDLIIRLGEVLLLYFGIKEIILGKLTIGSYVAFTGYILYIFSPMTNLSNISILLDYAKRSYNRIKELMDILPEDSGTIEIDKIAKIAITNLNFSYTGKESVIKNLNFEIVKGDKVIFEGESGSGKSTFIKLLLGLYRPQEGAIFYNGVNLKKIDLKKLREKVGYISQNIFLFNKTIKENIIFENKDISSDQLKKLFKECRLEKMLSRFKKGLEEEISEKGDNVSGGERQRIAFVRALIKDPDVIIIDEGTSNLDIETEEEILKLLEKSFKDRIILRITHRRIDNDEGWRRIVINS
jgi:ABC-type bacteriocin/lantibiotic exporter with double-glycine peptidase domain